MKRCLTVAYGLSLVLAGVGPLPAGESETAAAKAVKKRGGNLKYDEKSPGEPVVGVDVKNLQWVDAEMKQLAAFVNLKELNLSGNDVTDKGLKELSGLTNLTELWVEDTKVTEAGVKELQKAIPKCKVHHGPSGRG